MNKYLLTSLLGILTLGFVFSTYTALQTAKRLDKFEKQYNTPIVIYPTQEAALPTQAPVDLENAHTWTVQSICTDKAGYEVYYQLSDGTNIYQKDDGTFVRGKKVICTN